MGNVRNLGSQGSVPLMKDLAIAFAVFVDPLSPGFRTPLTIRGFRTALKREFEMEG
jgi:hypothetical protein